MNHSNNEAPATIRSAENNPTQEWEGDFSCIEFFEAPEPMVAAHIPMQED